MNSDRTKQYFWFFLNIFIAALIANVLFFVMPTIQKFGDSFHPARVISVSAEGKTYVVPDIAQLSFSVVSRGQNPNTLADENNRKINSAIEFVKKEGIDAKDIRTTGYNLAPDYRYEPDTERSIITGYTLTQTVTVKIRDFGKISTILGGLTPLGINQISGVNFTVDDQEKYVAEARAEAFQKARAKAAQMAKENGVGLGRVLNVSESSGGYPIPFYAERGGFGGDFTAPKAPVIEPGTEELRVTVSVTYALR
ncbi:MAG: SIMPL domain-containing protein [Candidatus Liptonbacteria bacterium]|nr:SIMPL domain-containing protein [Candidatus Liptonbacteria bacterium]